MLKTTLLGLAAAAALSLAALTPALANYGTCTENPEAKGCPGYVGPESNSQAPQPAPRHLAHSHQHTAPQKG